MRSDTHSRSQRTPARLALITSAALCAWACNPKTEAPPAAGSAPPAPAAAPTLRRTLNTPQSLDPAAVGDVGGATVIGDLFDGLYRVGPGGRPILAAAEDHAFSPDGRTHTFTLRATGRWSNGAPVTAADFVYGWLRALDPAVAGAGAHALYAIAGARAYNGATAEADRGALRAAVGVEARDPRTLVVRLERPDPRLAFALTRPAAVPLSQAAVEAHPDAWMTPPHAVTNGPWSLSARDGQRIVARRNPHYAPPAPFAAIEYLIVEDEAAAYNLYRTDKLDYIAGKVPAAALGTLRRARDPELRVVPFAGVDFYLFNTTRPPFDDPRVRRALSLALDRSVIGDQILKGGELAAHSLIPPGLGGAGGPSFDPDRAAALLAEAGYGPKQPLRRFALSHDQSEPARRLAEYAQQQWKKILGVDCDLRSMERKALIDQQRALDYDLSRAAWFADVPDAAAFLEPWIGGSRANRSGWADPAFDATLKRLEALTDPAARRAATRTAEAILMEALPGMPTFVHVRSDLVKPHIAGHDPETGMYHPSRLFRPAD